MQSPTVHALAQRARFVHGAARGPCTIEDRLSKAARSKKCMVGCRAHRCDNSDILPTDHRSRFEFIFMRPYTITWFALEVYVILRLSCFHTAVNEFRFTFVYIQIVVLLLARLLLFHIDSLLVAPRLRLAANAR